MGYNARNHDQGVMVNPNNKRVYPCHFYYYSSLLRLSITVIVFLLVLTTSCNFMSLRNYLRIYQSAQTTRRRKFQRKREPYISQRKNLPIESQCAAQTDIFACANLQPLVVSMRCVGGGDMMRWCDVRWYHIILRIEVKYNVVGCEVKEVRWSEVTYSNAAHKK